MHKASNVNELCYASKDHARFDLISNYATFVVRRVFRDREAGGVNAHLSGAATLLAQVIVMISESHHCHDRRDEVFGVLGLVDEADVSHLRLDYGMPWADLYTTICQFLLTGIEGEEDTRWIILAMATRLGDKMDGLPSWCPDLHRKSLGIQRIKLEPMPLSVNLDKYEGRSRASTRPSCLRPGASSREIILRGRVLDTIDRVLPPLSTRLPTSGSLYTRLQKVYELVSWEKSIAEQVLGPGALDQPATIALSSTNMKEGQITKDDYWRTLVGHDSLRWKYSITYDTICEFRAVLGGLGKMLERFDRLQAE